MAEAREGDKVKVHYTGRLSDGTEFDSSVGLDPLEFTIGDGEIIAGFEQAVIGMQPGQSKTIEVPAAEAYGPYQDEMVHTIERSAIPEEIGLEVGKQLYASDPEGGETMMLTVIEISEETVTLDGNPPLAGEDLTFEIELLSIA